MKSMKRKVIAAARKRFEEYLAVFGMKVCHSRRLETGEIRVYLYQFWGKARVCEVRWDPRRPFVMSWYHDQPNEFARSLTTSVVRERYSDEQLADWMVNVLAETV